MEGQLGDPSHQEDENSEDSDHLKVQLGTAKRNLFAQYKSASENPFAQGAS